jgi:hypothetical protein
MTAPAALASARRTSSRWNIIALARNAYASRILGGTIDEASTGGGLGIPLDVLSRIQGRSPAAGWCEVADYYALRVEGRLVYASITRGGAGETIHLFSASGEPLTHGAYPVDEDGKPCGDVLWR